MYKRKSFRLLLSFDCSIPLSLISNLWGKKLRPTNPVREFLMASSVFLYAIICCNRTNLLSPKAIFCIPTLLALFTTTCILFYICSTSNYLLVFPSQTHVRVKQSSATGMLSISSSTSRNQRQTKLSAPGAFSNSTGVTGLVNLSVVGLPTPFEYRKISHFAVDDALENTRLGKSEMISSGNYVNNEVFHDRDFFVGNYGQMNRSLKIYVYSHRSDDPFANILLPVNFEPGGNYASESYFKKVLMISHFITKDPSKADLFFLPFSIARLRHDPRVGIRGIQDFIRNYISNISHEYPYWNRSGGADHFYVACHSVGRSAMEKTIEVKLNAIQVVCSSSYYVSAYVPHKDASLPQIWPRQGDNPDLASYERRTLVFFSGSLNSPVRENLLRVWGNDTEISVHTGHLEKPYTEELLSSKFCLHVKGFEVNTARISDALYYGCVPVIIANHYDLPFADVLNWKSFSVVVATLDIPKLKKILQGISTDEYLVLKNNVINARKHFHWHLPPFDYDAFYMVMHELWLRRSSLRVSG
ncbi:probable glycosyltransferase At3g07620 [Coffea arabica]|uniref:Probable glycosyltransferase At3g07620 n=1 Tax=Coffea arabica TaxID=13443 RepID=A0ABM4UMR3_COFAR|nr:probable glycosyltransferase At3g07620 [Coffea arabica]